MEYPVLAALCLVTVWDQVTDGFFGSSKARDRR